MNRGQQLLKIKNDILRLKWFILTAKVIIKIKNRSHLLIRLPRQVQGSKAKYAIIFKRFF